MQAGVVLAQRLTGLPSAMHGVTATSEFHVPSRTATIANETAQVLGLDLVVSEGEIVNFHCRVDPMLTVQNVHEKVDDVERALRRKFPTIKRVIGHAEPLP